LDEEDRAFGVEAGGKPIEEDFYAVFGYGRGVGPVRQGVEVGDLVEAVVFVLEGRIPERIVPFFLFAIKTSP
jgi:hypothetical protein